MASNHYHTLGVAPWAEDAVIRAAYVALMRTYHPDRNRDPEAEARTREITGAFSVLSDSQRRAAYDAHLALRHETGMDEDFRRPTAPPMRRLGLASVALAVIVSVSFAVWPRSEPEPDQGLKLHRAAAAAPRKMQVPTAPILSPEPKAVVQPASLSSPVPQPTVAKSVPAQAPAHEAVSVQPKARATPKPKPEIAQAALPKAAPPVPIAASRPPAAAPPPQAAAMNERRVQVERIANGFFRQSMEHADARKQQLLMDSSNRSAASRAACRSDDCVTGAYLRQIRETTAIVQGQTPAQ